MKCNLCKRKVRNSFVDKLKHAIEYHPDTLLSRFNHLPAIAYSVGERLGVKARSLYGKGS